METYFCLEKMTQQQSGAQVIVLPQTEYLLSLMTIIRNSDTTCPAFVHAFDRVCNQLLPAALNLLPFEKVEVTTPTGNRFCGAHQTSAVCGVSILRAGSSMENALRNASLGPLCYGKILIQRDEETCLPKEIYSKLPRDIGQQSVLVLEPMLATGNSASKALEILINNGVKERDIIFTNLLASRKGLDQVIQKFPAIKFVTAAIDEELTATNYINPGLGDFGDRFYGTTG